MSFSDVHLFHEINMCDRLAREANQIRGHPIYDLLKNAIVESYAIHLRSLIDFLYKDPEGDDVGAVHYVRDVEAWTVARGDRPHVLTDARIRAAKQVAHLTRRRFLDGAPEKNWYPEVEMTALAAPLRVFAQHADPRRLHSAVVSRIEQLQEEA
jgi:hypothetical protein